MLFAGISICDAVRKEDRGRDRRIDTIGVLLRDLDAGSHDEPSTPLEEFLLYRLRELTCKRSEGEEPHWCQEAQCPDVDGQTESTQ